MSPAVTIARTLPALLQALVVVKGRNQPGNVEWRNGAEWCEGRVSAVTVKPPEESISPHYTLICPRGERYAIYVARRIRRPGRGRPAHNLGTSIESAWRAEALLFPELSRMCYSPSPAKIQPLHVHPFSYECFFLLFSTVRRQTYIVSCVREDLLVWESRKGGSLEHF